jgi:signal transduction histidine kinase
MLPVRRDTFKVYAVAGDDAENVLGTEWAYEESISAHSMRTGEVVVVEDLSQAPGGPARYAGWGRTVIVPLTISNSGKSGILSGEVLGVLTLSRKAGAPPPPHDELELMSDFATQASLALEYSRAQEDRSQLAIFSDRDRIGRDLHDLVIQRIFAIGMTVNSMVDPGSDSTANKRMVAIVDDLDATIKDIRGTIHQLQHDQGGTDHRVQIRRAISEATPGLAESALKLDFVGDIATGIPDGQMPLLIDALSELLDNVMRHAQASIVEVTIDVGVDLRLVVADDGLGIPADQQRRVGLGRLRGLAESLGGSMTLGAPEHGTGTVVVWRIPVGDDA